MDSKYSRALKKRGEAVDVARLEGDFNKYFSLYFRKDDQINALSIITPDIMKTLIDFNTNQDIEVIDENLFFMSYADQRNANVLPSLFKSVDALANEIRHKSKTIRFITDKSCQERMMTAKNNQYFQKSWNLSDILRTVTIVLLVAIITFAIITVTLSIMSSAPTGQSL